MHAFGGVYIDVDVECLQPVDGFLEDHELVFQEEDFGQKSLVNSAIAGVPGHHFWTVWQQVIHSRCAAFTLGPLTSLTPRAGGIQRGGKCGFLTQ